jgi:carboxypeptidase PM20D1
MIIESIAVILITICVICGGLIMQTFRFTSQQLHPTHPSPISIDITVAANNLAHALTYETISHQDPAQRNDQEFFNLHSYLEETFPAVHAQLSREPVNTYSLLYTWEGSDPTLLPIVLMAHLDVVPVETGTEEEWTHPPFKGAIADGCIWGRGSMDIKEGVLGLLEAVELLLKEEFRPRRTIYLAFGHDEEIGGSEGAQTIVEVLKGRTSSVEYVLDEGGSITQGIVPGVDSPVALVGIAEKGYVSLELSVESEGGHSSMPPPETTIGILSAALTSLERNQMPASLSGAINRFFAYIGPEMNFTRKLVFANTWLFSPIIVHKLSQSPYTNAMIRTTTAPTIVEGGSKENILPKRAKCVVNFRILPGDTVESVTEHVKTVIDDPRIMVTPLKESWNPSAVSDDTGASFHVLHKTIGQIFPDAVVAPFLVTGATDSRHYAGISNHIFKFIPFMTTREDLKRVHGTDERISIEDYEQCIRFYVQLIRNSTS